MEFLCIKIKLANKLITIQKLLSNSPEKATKYVLGLYAILPQEKFGMKELPVLRSSYVLWPVTLTVTVSTVYDANKYLGRNCILP